MTHYSLGHADKRFELYHEGRELLNASPVASLRDRAFQVFGSAIIDDLIDLHLKTFEIAVGRRARAVRTGRPDLRPARPKAKSQLDFPVRQRPPDPRQSIARTRFRRPTHNLMPSGCYPFALLFLHCDASEVDVNVHPSKTEVRFRHGSAIHDFVRDAIRESLIESRPASSIPILPVSPVPSGRAPVQRAADLPFSEFTAMTETVFLEPESAAPEPVKNGMQILPEVTIAPLPRPSVFPETAAAALPPVTPLRRIPDTHGALESFRETGTVSILSGRCPISAR